MPSMWLQVATGYDDYTVMAISGHSSTRMLARCTHPTEKRKISALDLPAGHKLTAPPTSTDLQPQRSQILRKKLVDGRGIEPLTSALRTQRSPS